MTCREAKGAGARRISREPTRQWQCRGKVPNMVRYMVLSFQLDRSGTPDTNTSATSTVKARLSLWLYSTGFFFTCRPMARCKGEIVQAAIATPKLFLRAQL